MAVHLEPNQFLTRFTAHFEEVEAGEILLETQFRDLAEWSSMQSLVVIASWDWDYGVTITAEELKAAQTVGDLYQIVKGKVD